MTRTPTLTAARTVAQLRPAQAAHRVRLRAQQALWQQWPAAAQLLTRPPDAADAVGWPAAFRPLDAHLSDQWPPLAELHAGKVTLLGVAAALAGPADWQAPGMPLLWRFHLHYWDWAWGLAADEDRLAARAVFRRLWLSWQRATPHGRGDAWRPYPAALRAWSWCGLHGSLAAGADFEGIFISALADHAGFLRGNLERDVGGNHLVKDLKALAGLAVFFGDGALLRATLRRLQRQLRLQVLADGGHCERSPAYHCQVLGDLIDVAGLLTGAGWPVPGGLEDAVARMRRCLGVLLAPDGKVPMLNDGFPVPGALIAALQPAGAADHQLILLPDTGLALLRAGAWSVLADVGLPCPGWLPAHAHADTLACLVCVNGQPLLVDTATSSYDPGHVRGYERSTAAHSTVEVDGADSTEVWGAFRAGRRARIRHLSVRTEPTGVVCDAAHDGYRGLPGRPRHRRRWSLTPAGLRVDDRVSGKGWHRAVVRWHLPPGSAAEVTGPGEAQVTGPAGRFDVSVSASGGMSLAVESAPVALGFLATADAPVLVCRTGAYLPIAVTTVWAGPASDARRAPRRRRAKSAGVTS